MSAQMLKRAWLASALLIVLSACGGGGSGGDSGMIANTAIANAILSYTVRDGGQTTRFSTDLSGSERVALPLESENTPINVPTSRISPDGRWLAYVDDERLFVTRTNQSSPRQVSQSLHNAVDLLAFEWSPNSEYLAYIGDPEVNNDRNVYVVAVEGNSHVQVNPSDVFPLDELQFSPDSQWITYRGVGTNTLAEGYVVAIDGTSSRIFTGSIPDNGTILSQFRWSPDGRYIAYFVYEISRTVGVNTHDTNLGGRNSERVSHDISLLFVELEDYRWSPDSARIAYSAKASVIPNTMLGPDDVRRLFVARAGVTASGVTVNGPMTNLIEVGDWAWSPDSNYIAYEVVSYANASTIVTFDQGINTFSIAQGGNGNTNSRRITLPVSASGIQEIDNMTWTPDSNYVVYLSRHNSQSLKELYRSAPNVSSTSTVLSLPTASLDSLDNAVSFAIAPNGQQVAFAQRTEGDGSSYDVYVNDIALPGAATQLSSPVAAGLLALTPTIQWSPQNTHIAYSSDGNTANKRELYTAPTTGTGSTRVSGNISATADVASFLFLQ